MMYGREVISITRLSSIVSQPKKVVFVVVVDVVFVCVVVLIVVVVIVGSKPKFKVLIIFGRS